MPHHRFRVLRIFLEPILAQLHGPSHRRFVAGETRKEVFAYPHVEPIGLDDLMPDMPLFLFEDFHVKVPLEPAYQATWAVFPRDLQVIVETGRMPALSEE